MADNIKEGGQTGLNDFEEKIKQIKAKHMKRDNTTELKKETESESDIMRRQKLLVNPKLKDIVSLFNNEPYEENRRSKIVSTYKSNLLMSSVNQIPKRYNASSKNDSGLDFNKADKQVKLEIKDQINALKISMISGGRDN